MMSLVLSLSVAFVAKRLNNDYILHNFKISITHMLQRSVTGIHLSMKFAD